MVDCAGKDGGWTRLKFKATAAEPTEMRDKGFGIDFILGSFSVVAAVSGLGFGPVRAYKAMVTRQNTHGERM